MVTSNESTIHDQADHDRLAAKRRRRAVAGLISLLCLVILFFELPTTFELLTGWVRFPFKVLPQVSVHWGGIGVFAVSFIVAVICFHFVAVWLTEHFQKLMSTAADEPTEGTQVQRVVKRWTLRASIATVSMFMLVFVVGICMAGVVHQTGWIINSPEGLAVPKVQAVADAKLANYDPNNTPAGTSWISACAPFIPFLLELDQTHSKPFNDPEVAANFKRVLPVSICPSQGNPIYSPDGFGLSHVAANTSALGGMRTDKNSMAAMLGEVSTAFDPWGSPTNHRDLELGISGSWLNAKRGSIGFGSVHSGGANIGFIDGSVKFVSDQTDHEVLKRMAQASASSE